MDNIIERVIHARLKEREGYMREFGLTQDDADFVVFALEDGPIDRPETEIMIAAIDTKKSTEQTGVHDEDKSVTRQGFPSQ